MANFNVTVFGPADGAVAFSYPDGKRAYDDALFLASSEFSLPEGGAAVRFTRSKSREGGITARVATYRQVFEPNMARLGHAYGVAFDFEANIPGGGAVIGVIEEVADLVRDHCVANGQFCRSDVFTRFLSEEISASIPGIKESLFAAESFGVLRSLSLEFRERLFFPADTVRSEDCGRLLDWFFRSGAGTAFEEAIISLNGIGSPGVGYTQARGLDAVTHKACSALYELASISLEAAEKTASELASVGEQLRRSMAESSQMRAKLDRAAELFSGAGGGNSGREASGWIASPASPSPFRSSTGLSAENQRLGDRHPPAQVGYSRSTQPNPRAPMPSKPPNERDEAGWTKESKLHPRQEQTFDWVLAGTVGVVLLAVAGLLGLGYLWMSPRYL